MISKDTITLDHGSGGLASQELIESFVGKLDNPILAALEDSSILDPIEGLSKADGRLAFSTDSYVVDPIFFPGGDIGLLAVHGTINDLAMRGAKPLCLSLALILEEGFAMAELKEVLSSIAKASKEAGVPVITGDTKVVPRGKGDKIFINTSGIGLVPEGLNISVKQAKPSDLIILSGTMADHGITILTRRSGLTMEGNLTSDTMALHKLVAELTASLGDAVHTLRDPTRGGVATSLCEIATAAGVGVTLDENAIPVRSDVQTACELLGMDPFYLANEGKCLVILAEDSAPKALEIMRSRPEGKDAAIIGRLTDGPAGRVVLNTAVGGRRLITALTGEPLPRIC